MEQKLNEILAALKETNEKLADALKRLERIEAQSQPPSPGNPPPPEDDDNV